MRVVLIISGSIAGIMFGGIYPAIILSYLGYHLGLKLNTKKSLIVSTRYKLIKATLHIMIAQARSKGVFLKRELNYVKNFLNYYFQVNEQEYNWYLSYMKKISFKENYYLLPHFRTIRKNTHYHERVFLLKCLTELAQLSGSVYPSERQIIYNFAKQQKIPFSVINLNRKKSEKLPSHYSILGAKPEMKLEEIRKKYIELVKFFHPDRYRHRSEAEQQYANDKMQKINGAWQQILKEKNR